MMSGVPSYLIFNHSWILQKYDFCKIRYKNEPMWCSVETDSSCKWPKRLTRIVCRFSGSISEPRDSSSMIERYSIEMISNSSHKNTRFSIRISQSEMSISMVMHSMRYISPGQEMRALYSSSYLIERR